MARGLIFITLLSVFLSCHKKQVTEDDGYVYISGTGFTGKWLAKERYVSPGGGASWVDMPRDQWFTFEFRSDSSIVYSDKMPKADSLYDRYSLEGDFVKVRSTVNGKTGRWYFEFLPDGRLNLNIIQCIEACSYGLHRIQ